MVEPSLNCERTVPELVFSVLKNSASELDRLGDQLDCLQDALSKSFRELPPETRENSNGEFQGLDTVTQHVRALSDLFSQISQSTAPDCDIQTALASVTLSALAHRLTHENGTNAPYDPPEPTIDLF